ncbi:MAG: DUF4286 family protein [Alphaproteobacteria bacterium]
MSKRVVYLVRVWINPKFEKQVLAWLDGGHTADVVGQPGFIEAHRYRLEQDAPDGWHAYVNLYLLESRQALENYFNDAKLHERFGRERAAFNDAIRAERNWGVLQTLETPKRKAVKAAKAPAKKATAKKKPAAKKSGAKKKAKR